MAPLTDVLIAKIVLGYLSSRKLLKTWDCFLKESEALNTDTAGHNKGRILNHLQDQNLLPSLEDILHDYFAYNETDNSTSDKTYQLWKQLDVIISQLRGISLGKKKAKAFLRTRKSGNTLQQVLSKRDHDSNVADIFPLKPPDNEHQEDEIQIKTSSIAEQQTQSPEHSVTWTHTTPSSPFKGTRLTPHKEHLKTESFKTFKSPKRKSHHPKRRSIPQPADASVKKVDFTPIKLSEENNDATFPLNISPILVNEEFNHIVELLVGSNTFSEKLADNINKVVNSDTKTEVRDNEKGPVDVQEVFKLTTHDPDMCDLLSMFGELNDITVEEPAAAMNATNSATSQSAINLNAYSNPVDQPRSSITSQESQNLHSAYIQQETLRSSLCSSVDTQVTSQNVDSQVDITDQQQNISSAVSLPNECTNIPLVCPDVAAVVTCSSSKATSIPASRSFVMNASPLFYTKLLNSEHSNDSSLMASCMRNLQQEINICSSTDQEDSHSLENNHQLNSNQFTAYTEPCQTSAAQQHFSSFERPADVLQCSENCQEPNNEDLNESDPPLDTPPFPVDMKTPVKVTGTIVNMNQQLKCADEESVSIATDALLLLATSPGKPSINFELAKNQFNFVNELNQPLKDGIVEQNGANTSFYEHFTAVSSQMSFNNIPVSEILVSDRQALSDPTCLPTRQENDSSQFFEKPHKDLLKKAPILPKRSKPPSTKVQYIQSPRNKALTLSPKEMSVSAQLGRKGHVVAGTKKRKSNAGITAENVVTRLLTFESSQLAPSTSLVHPIVIATMQGVESVKPANSFVYMNCDFTDVSNDKTMTSQHDIPRCSVNINATKLNSHSPFQQSFCEESQGLPVTPISSSNMQNFRIQGAKISAKGNKKNTDSFVERSSSTPVVESNRDNVTVTWTNSFIGDFTATADATGNTLQKGNEVESSITVSSEKPLLKTPKCRKNPKELKVKFSFKSPKKKGSIVNRHLPDVDVPSPHIKTAATVTCKNTDPNNIAKHTAVMSKLNSPTVHTPIMNAMTDNFLYCNEEPLVSIKTSPVVNGRDLLNVSVDEKIHQYFMEHKEDDIDIIFCSETSSGNPTFSTDSKFLEPIYVQSNTVNKVGNSNSNTANDVGISTSNILHNCLKPTASVKPFVQYSLVDSRNRTLSSSAVNLLRASQNTTVKKRKLSDTSYDKIEESANERKELKRQRNLHRLLQMGPDEYLLKVKV